MGMKWWVVALVGWLGSLVACAAPVCPDPVRIGYLNVHAPPMLLGQGQEFTDPPGWQVLAMREAARKLGCRVRETRLPGLRLDAMLNQGDVDFSLFFGVTEERLQWLRFPLDAAGQPDRAWAPLMGSLVLYAPAGSPQAQPGVAWDGQRLAPGVRVGVVSRTVQEKWARQRSWPLERTLTIDNAMQMLRAQRFDLLLTTRETMRPEWVQAGALLVELSPAVDHLPFFVVASRRMWEQDAAFTQAFWQEACRAVRQLAPDARPAECGVRVGPAVKH